MMSIAVHVLLFVVAGLLYASNATTPMDDAVTIRTAPLPSDPLEEEPPEDLLPVTPTAPVEEPPIKNAEIAERVEEDNDLPYEETIGDEGRSEAPYQGPANNEHIGWGGSAGKNWGTGRGGNKDTTTGISESTEIAVEDALKWLAAHQSPGGRLGGRGLRPLVRRQAGPTRRPRRRAGRRCTTSASRASRSCAFLGAGYTNRGRSTRSRRSCRKGLRYLKNVQDAEGCFGPRSTQHYVYNHATATLAMVEAYGDDGKSRLQGLGPEGARLHRARAQPVLRLALRRQARRQRHLGHRAG